MESSIDEGKRKWMPLLIRERWSRGRYILREVDEDTGRIRVKRTQVLIRGSGCRY